MQFASHGQRPFARFAAPSYLCAVLRRPRLEDRLRDAIKQRAATLITAPAGYGKSCLVASVTKEAEAAGARLVWIAMDASDNSYDRLIHALDRAFRSGPGRTSAPDLAAVPSRVGAYSYLIDLLEDLSDPASPFILVLDDYEVVEEHSVHELVEGLIKRFVPHVHIVILSRITPPLALSPLRHRHQLCEISAADLAFSRDEIVDLIREGFHQDLAADNLHVIETRTEGWPVAVQLVGTALAQQRDAHAFIAELSGRDSDVADFLNAEVLARLPPDLFDFLLRISPLTRVSHDLCAAVTGEADAAIMLDRIVRSNLLLFPLDRNNSWFRLHPLFRDYLLGQMALRSEVSRDAILRRAMGWCEAHGPPEDAINYALELDDQADAARLLMHHAEHFVYTTGEHAQFLAWMKRLRTYPDYCSFDLKYWQAWALIISLRQVEAEAALRELDLLLAASPAEEQNRVRIARREIIHILICIFSDQIDDCVTEASEWLNNFPDADPFDISSMATSFAVTTMSTGEFAAGRSALQTARYAAIAARSPYAESWVGIAEGGIALSTGDF
ncbi:MAG: hypothetical protein PHS60_16095, partial [Zavarzinia sp.]|nr:hypothetical protein [Zavarzinia sp.]